MTDTRRRTLIRWPDDEDLLEWYRAQARERDVSLNHLVISACRAKRRDEEARVLAEPA